MSVTAKARRIIWIRRSVQVVVLGDLIHGRLGLTAELRAKLRALPELLGCELILIGVILMMVALLTLLETHVIQFDANIPVSNTILMFILININLLLLILMIYLVFRNLVKLIYDRRRNVLGAKIRTKLVIAFVSLTLLPTIVLFFFALNFITTSIEFWFDVPVEQALENSLWVGGRLYSRTEENNKFFIERISYQIKTKNLLDAKNRKALSHYIRIVQREFNLDAVEVYAPDAERLTFALAPKLENEYFGIISAEDIKKELPAEGIRSISQAIPSGEFIKTIGTIPFGVKPGEAIGFVVATILIPEDLAENLQFIRKGFTEYQQIKLLKKPIQITYYISLSIVALLVLFCAVWFGFFMARSISLPIKELAEGTRRVADGNLDYSIDPVSDDEFGSRGSGLVGVGLASSDDDTVKPIAAGWASPDGFTWSQGLPAHQACRLGRRSP